MLYKESSSLELKVKFTNNILKTISAFSNDNGGKVIVGIDDLGNVVGIENIIKVKLDIENTINDTINPRPSFTMKITQRDNKDLLEINVSKGDAIPYYYKGIAYTRSDTSTIPLEGINLTKLIMKDNNLSFDQLKTDTKSLTFKYLETLFIDKLNIKQLETPTLLSLGLIQDNSYNNGAVLLSDTPDISHSYVDIAKFKLDTNTFEDRIKISNLSILEFYEIANEVFEKYYQNQEIVAVPRRITIEPVPKSAFKEALANALVHRNYLIKGGIQIAMFDNMIEIRSPGGLPEGITKDLYLQGLTSISRNPILSFVFFRLGIIEQFGTGVKRIINSYKNSNFKPVFNISENQIKLTLPVINFDYSYLKMRKPFYCF